MATLNELRAALTADQRRVLNAIWRYQRERNRNMPKIALYKELNTDETTLQTMLKGLSGDIICSSSNSEVWRSYGLTYLGRLLAEKGEELEDLLARFISYVRTQLNAKDVGDRSAHSRRFIAHRPAIDRIIDDLRLVTQELVYLAGLK